MSTAAPNSSTYLLPVLASEIGRSASHQTIRYWMESYPVDDGSTDPGNPVFNFDVMTTGTDDTNTSALARFDTFDNPISSGDLCGRIVSSIVA